MSQWTERQADEYFRRNLHVYGQKPAMDRVLEGITDALLACQADTSRLKILDIGCANGHRLAFLRDNEIGCEHAGMDMSPVACADGRTRWGLTIQQCKFPNDYMPYKLFDMIIISYVFMYIPRKFMLQAIKKVDESLADGGILVINDFCPHMMTLDGASAPQFFHNSHGDCDVWKADNANMFLATGCYRPMWFKQYQHDGRANLSREAMVCLLQKGSLYVEEQP